MAGSNELLSPQQQGTESDYGFQWDENSQLYYHSSTGFYYNPQAGWYHSSRDGLYYKFENGNYVLLDSSFDGGDQYEKSRDCGEMVPKQVDEDKQCISVEGFRDDECLAERKVTDEETKDLECVKDHLMEDPGPPSEWLEDTLIDLFLSGYRNQGGHTASDTMEHREANDIGALGVSADGDNDIYELEEGEWVPEDHHASTHSSGNMTVEGLSWDEKNWHAQYGQVAKQNEESVSDIQVINLWDWEMVRGATKKGKDCVSKLVGSLVKCSNKLHPAVPSGGNRLRTAAICETHLDLVRVQSGQIYRLRRPSKQYVESLSAYDSSNPTGDWGFPQLSVGKEPHPLERFDGHTGSKGASPPFAHSHALKKERSIAYRDRAAERRALHGGFGVGPGQKKSPSNVDSSSSPPSLAFPEEGAAESMDISFGEGSYGRKLLEGMGWKEGEALGRSTQGLREPLKATRNKGNAGLGWNDNKRKHFVYDVQ